MGVSKKKNFINDIQDLMGDVSYAPLTELQIRQRGDAIEQMINTEGWKTWLEPYIRRCIAATAANIVLATGIIDSMEKVQAARAQALAYRDVFDYINETIRERNKKEKEIKKEDKKK